MTALHGLIVALLLSFAAELRLQPGCALPWRRPPLALWIHLLATAQAYALLLALTARVEFSLLLTLALGWLVVLISNAKLRSLQEPLVFSDVYLLQQVFRYPRLYFPFVGTSTRRGWGALAVLLALVFGFWLDPHHPQTSRLEALLGAVAASALWLGCAPWLHIQLQPIADHQRLGFFATLYSSLGTGLRRSTSLHLQQALRQGPFAAATPTAASEALPDIVLIQSESFFDARRLGPQVHPHLLPHFDRACGEALSWGRLAVPAFGANTMRTEFAVLAGLPPSVQGYAQYYPYAFVRAAQPSLAAWFRARGYSSTFIHPYHADFFGRQRVMPHLGFQQFIDISAFVSADYAGPYVGDHAVADRIMHTLDQAAIAGGPAFVMAVTMENHGPLHLETVSPGEANRYHGYGEGGRLNDLTAYLRHLVHADAMIGTLLAHLSQRTRPAIVCFYGDHVPALPELFADLRSPQSTTDYFIWHSDRLQGTTGVNLNAADLGVQLIQATSAVPLSYYLHPSNDPGIDVAGPSAN